ncbi:sensor histidine kinase [Roseburia intestinalis]|jgi:two-component system sensor histidine kinase AgrC|uniref:sensor histidine kinase n=1 Tax=Roseburia intestinalis TaxID=166486 RepID=UPI00189D306C|nr:sensor histidine kinase [Roseburia intestinalis]
MFELMQSVLLIFIEIMCCKIFYETFGEIRYKGWINIIQFVLLLGSMCLLAYGFSEYFAIRQIIAILMFSIFMFWHVRISLKKSFVLAILFDALLLAMDFLAFLIMSWLSLDMKISEQQYAIASVLAYLLVKVVLFFLILVIRKQFAKKSMEKMLDTEWLRFLFFPVFTISAIAVMLSVFESVQTVEQANLLAVIAFGMVGMNILVFYLINDIMEREVKMHENKVFQIQAKNQLEMYRSISENFDNLKKKTHEFKNQISCIESLLDKKQYFKLEEYVKKIYGSLNNEPDAINTNNVIVNAILNTKYQEAEAKGIVFVFKVNDLSELQMKDEDVVTILANLLNNAIEACEACEDKKVIKFKFFKEDDKIIIAVKNTFNYDVIYENGEIKSTKTSSLDEHGVGIKNVLKSIEKYGGSYVIEDKNKEFFFSIIIPA